jgi:hypothetical protein
MAVVRFIVRAGGASELRAVTAAVELGMCWL